MESLDKSCDSLKIMVIDDDVGLLRLLETVIRNMNLIPITAASALEGISIISGGSVPDLILLDIKMPGICGFETYTRLRRINNLERVKIIAFTAYAHEWEKDHIFNHGFNDYIGKPFRKADFIKTITRALLTAEDNEPVQPQQVSACH